MNLAEAAKLPPAPIDKRTRCGVAEWIKSLPESESEGAEILLADRLRRTVDIFEMFADVGFPLRYDALVKHRNRRCSCR